MKNWTLRQRLLASFAALIAIMLLMAGMAYAHLLNIERSEHKLQTDALPGLYYTDRIRGSVAHNLLLAQQLLNVAPSSEQGKALLQQLREQDGALQELLAKYQASTSSEEDQSIFARLQAHLHEYEAQKKQLIALYEGNQLDQARQLMQHELLANGQHGQGLLDQLVELNHNSADALTAGIVASVSRAETSMLLSLLLAVLAALACGYLLMRAILDPLQQVLAALARLRDGNLGTRLTLARRGEFGALETGLNDMAEALSALVAQSQRSAISVTTSVTEIAATSKEQQATATETAATTTEIGATSREIAATSRDLLRTMGEVSSAAEQAANLADSGQNGLTRMEDTMHQVIAAAELINTKLTSLNEKAGNITQVVTTIVKVADQTNLLSLNAAIEAEKAGEYGRGFAVVANEVRRLADQTAVATYDIEQMVREIQSAVSAGVMGMDKFSEEVRRGMADVQLVGDQLAQIIQQTQALAPRVSMVNEGMQAQASGAEQISQALVQLAEVTGQTVDSLRQTSSAIDELSQVASGLRAGVSRFQV
jgi:methyl-accepting chemotaxis protein WspA